MYQQIIHATHSAAKHLNMHRLGIIAMIAAVTIQLWLTRDLLVRLCIAMTCKWCTWRGRVVTFSRTDNGEPYMTRYAILRYLSGDKPRRAWLKWLPNIYLHQIHTPDEEKELHNHPWKWAASLILRGSYLEERAAYPNLTMDRRAVAKDQHGFRNQTNMRAYAAGQFNFLRAGFDYHRIAYLADEPCWTLFITGPFSGRGWGFLEAGRGPVDHWTYRAEAKQREHDRFHGEQNIALGKAVHTVLEQRFKTETAQVLSELSKQAPNKRNEPRQADPQGSFIMQGQRISDPLDVSPDPDDYPPGEAPA